MNPIISIKLHLIAQKYNVKPKEAKTIWNIFQNIL